MAGEPFITLPPNVPTLRVDGEPTNALASARPGRVAATSGWVSMVACETSAPIDTPLSVTVSSRSASMRSMATTCSGSGALP